MLIYPTTLRSKQLENKALPIIKATDADESLPTEDVLPVDFYDTIETVIGAKENFTERINVLTSAVETITSVWNSLSNHTDALAEEYSGLISLSKDVIARSNNNNTSIKEINSVIESISLFNQKI